jgi:hypothetical protein
MKTNLLKNAFIACVSIAFIAAVFTACSKSNDSVTTADQTKLTALVDSCTTLLSSTTVATDYPAASITAFQTVLTNAKTAALVTTITQTAVDNLVINLRAAKTTFLAAAYGAIPSSALLFGLSFDEGTGTQLTTTGTYNWTAVLAKGPSEIFGTATNLPSFVTGKVGKAMYFSNGSHLEISNYIASALQGTKLSISVWVNPDSTRAGNYIISYNYWNSWKLNLQTANKPFFTVATTAGITDADDQLDLSAPNKTWTHLVVSLDLSAGTLSFYVNGVNKMTWTAETQPLLTGTISSYATVLPLMIGACTTYTEANAWTWTWAHTPANWDSFIGSMDELKVYNVALTDGQVAKLYKDENN